MRLVIWILRLYPLGWRERYETEMVALLEQHENTFWTVIDLLVGVLDARLDPHFRYVRPLVPLRRLLVSWRLMGSACVAFLLMFSLWSLNDIQPDTLNTLVAAHAPIVASAILNITSVLASLSLLFLLSIFMMWAAWRTMKNAWNLLRFFPIACFILYVFVAPSLSELQQVVWLIVCIAALAEGVGAMLTPGKRWIEEECGGSQLNDRERPVFALLLGLPTLLMLLGMALVCLACGARLAGIWKMFPLISHYDQYMQIELVVTLGLMVLATLIAFFAFARGTLAFRAVHAASPKHEPLQHIREQG